VPAILPLAVKVCAMLAPLAFVAPVTPDWVTVQVKVDPVTLLVSAIEVAIPEQIV